MQNDTLRKVWSLCWPKQELICSKFGQNIGQMKQKLPQISFFTRRTHTSLIVTSVSYSMSLFSQITVAISIFFFKNIFHRSAFILIFNSNWSTSHSLENNGILADTITNSRRVRPMILKNIFTLFVEFQIADCYFLCDRVDVSCCDSCTVLHIRLSIRVQIWRKQRSLDSLLFFDFQIGLYTTECYGSMGIQSGFYRNEQQYLFYVLLNCLIYLSYACTIVVLVLYLIILLLLRFRDK